MRRESPWSRGGCSAILRLPRNLAVWWSLGYTPFWNTAFAGMKQFWQGFLRLLNPGVENCSPVLSPWAWSSVLGLLELGVVLFGVAYGLAGVPDCDAFDLVGGGLEVGRDIFDD